MAISKPRETRVDLDAPDSRKALAKLVMQLFRLWKISTADQLNLLGLSGNSRAMLSKYARGEALPSTATCRTGWDGSFRCIRRSGSSTPGTRRCSIPG